MNRLSRLCSQLVEVWGQRDKYGSFAGAVSRAEWIVAQMGKELETNGWTPMERERPELHLYGFLWRRSRPVLVTDGHRWAVAQREMDEQNNVEDWLVWPVSSDREPERLAFEPKWWMEGPTPPGMLPEAQDWEPIG